MLSESEIKDKMLRESVERKQLDALRSMLEPDTVDPNKGKINIKNYESYERAIELLNVLKEKGKLTFEYTPLDKNYDYHEIYITWTLDDMGYASLDKSETKILAEILNNCSLLMDTAFNNVWRLETEIFVQTETK